MNIKDKKNLLSPKWRNLIISTSNLPYCYGTFKNLEDLHQKEKIDIVIESKTNGFSVLLLETLKKLDLELGQTKSEKRRSEILKQIEAINNIVILGEYKPAEKNIYLYIDTIKSQPSDHENYLVTTYIHEMMHAYFNRTGHEIFPYVYQKEEALAEAGMLVYLDQLNNPLLTWAHKNVKNGIEDYARGAYMFDDWKNGQTDLITIVTEYKNFPSTFDINGYRRKRDAFEDYLLFRHSPKTYSLSTAVMYACSNPLARSMKNIVSYVTNGRTDNLYDVVSKVELDSIKNNLNNLFRGPFSSFRYIKTIELYEKYLEKTGQLKP